MTIEVSRRFFLIGSAAALAATQIPLVPRSEVAEVIANPAAGLRRIYEWIMGVREPPVVDELVRVKMFRGAAELPLFDVGFHTRNTLRWIAYASSQEFIFPPNDVLRLECNPGIKTAHIAFSSHWPDGKNYLEAFDFDGTRFVAEPPVPYDLLPRDDGGDDEDYDADLYNDVA